MFLRIKISYDISPDGPRQPTCLQQVSGSFDSGMFVCIWLNAFVHDMGTAWAWAETIDVDEFRDKMVVEFILNGVQQQPL